MCACIVTISNDDGSYDEVGNLRRILVRDLKTTRGVVNRVCRIRSFIKPGRTLRLQWYATPKILGVDPTRVEFIDVPNGLIRS